MNKILLSLVFISGFMSAHVDSMLHDQTERVMQGLKKSLTLFRSSNNWRERVQISGDSVKTAFARTATDDSCWWFYYRPTFAGYLYHLSHKMNPLHLKKDSQSGYFAIKNHDGVVEITSTLVDTKMVPTTQEEIDIYNTIQREYDGRAIEHVDSRSICKHTLKNFFDKANHRIERTVLSECVTKMPVDEFMKAIR